MWAFQLVTQVVEWELQVVTMQRRGCQDARMPSSDLGALEVDYEGCYPDQDNLGVELVGGSMNEHL